MNKDRAAKIAKETIEVCTLFEARCRRTVGEHLKQMAGSFGYNAPEAIDDDVVRLVTSHDENGLAKFVKATFKLRKCDSIYFKDAKEKCIYDITELLARIQKRLYERILATEIGWNEIQAYHDCADTLHVAADYIKA